MQKANNDENYLNFRGKFSFKYAKLDLDNIRTISYMDAFLILDSISLEVDIVYELGEDIGMSMESPWNEGMKLQSFELIRNRIIEREN